MTGNIFSGGIEGIYIASPSNLFYFSGLQNDDARILLTPQENYYFTDARSMEEARELITGFTMVDVERGEYAFTASQFIANLGIKKLGYEDESILYREYHAIDWKDRELIPAETAINAKRSVKAPAEIAKIVAAQAITDKVFIEMLEFIRPGVTEVETAAKLNSLIYGYGATLAFDSIVAFGKNTSKPHSHPSDNVLNNRDCVLLDFGAKYKGYCSDMTRSFAVGGVSDKYRETYYRVLESQQNAISALKAGITGREGDALARDVLKDSGLSDFFTHSLGHSLGVDIHEKPVMSPRSNEIIPVGAVLSVEPGVYFEGEFGIRIEDIVLFNNNSVDRLTASPKDLLII
ncbi:MAG: aminopeptidase P family protein [Clostridia bacterium]